MKIVLTVVAILALTGCASRGSVSDLNDRVDDLTYKLETVSTEVSMANAKSDEALNRAAESDIKLDRMFEKSQYK